MCDCRSSHQYPQLTLEFLRKTTCVNIEFPLQQFLMIFLTRIVQPSALALMDENQNIKMYFQIQFDQRLC